VDQKTILNLLLQAAAPDCSDDRRREIREELLKAVVSKDDVPPELSGTTEGIRMVCEFLFREVTEQRPTALIGLLPLFIATCGVRSPDANMQPLLANIDWSSM